MHRRRITLPDGRYLIYYTFGEPGDTGGAEGIETGSGARGDEPHDSSSTGSEEERRV